MTLFSAVSALLLAAGSTELAAAAFPVANPSSPDGGYFLSKSPWKLEK
jgi:hypothetical protein